MLKYWPQKPSIELNNAVVDLFITTHSKFKQNLSNTTNKYLYIDILNNNHKYRLFNSTLKELKILILDIIELDLTIENLQKLERKILYDFIYKILIKFLYIQNINDNYYSKVAIVENSILIETILIYLIFGTSFIDRTLFIFTPSKTPKEHVQILFENFIIQISNLIMYNILNNIQSVPEIVSFLQINNLSNNNYISTRSISLFLNQLIWQNLLYTYIYIPKGIYSARYELWLISSKGLTTKYIYISRLKDLYQLSKMQLFILFWIELIDIVIPKIENFLFILGKYLVYIFINLLGNIIILLIRTVFIYLNK